MWCVLPQQQQNHAHCARYCAHFPILVRISKYGTNEQGSLRNAHGIVAVEVHTTSPSLLYLLPLPYPPLALPALPPLFFLSQLYVPRALCVFLLPPATPYSHSHQRIKLTATPHLPISHTPAPSILEMKELDKVLLVYCNCKCRIGMVFRTHSIACGSVMQSENLKYYPFCSYFEKINIIIIKSKDIFRSPTRTSWVPTSLSCAPAFTLSLYVVRELAPVT